MPRKKNPSTRGVRGTGTTRRGYGLRVRKDLQQNPLSPSSSMTQSSVDPPPPKRQKCNENQAMDLTIGANRRPQPNSALPDRQRYPAPVYSPVSSEDEVSLPDTGAMENIPSSADPLHSPESNASESAAEALRDLSNVAKANPVKIEPVSPPEEEDYDTKPTASEMKQEHSTETDHTYPGTSRAFVGTERDSTQSETSDVSSFQVQMRRTAERTASPSTSTVKYPQPPKKRNWPGTEPRTETNISETGASPKEEMHRGKTIAEDSGACSQERKRKASFEETFAPPKKIPLQGEMTIDETSGLVHIVMRGSIQPVNGGQIEAGLSWDYIDTSPPVNSMRSPESCEEMAEARKRKTKFMMRKKQEGKMKQYGLSCEMDESELRNLQSHRWNSAEEGEKEDHVVSPSEVSQVDMNSDDGSEEERLIINEDPDTKSRPSEDTGHVAEGQDTEIV